MPRTLVLRLPSAVFATALAAVATLAAAPAAEASYPTDVCVARKLEAVADACRDALFEPGRSHGRGHHGWSKRTSPLERAWLRAEARSSEDGVDCVQTTVTADEMAQRLDTTTDAVLDAAAGPSVARHAKHRHHAARAEAARKRAAAFACSQWLRAEARHLEYRANDRDRSKLTRTRERVLSLLRLQLARTGGGRGPGSLAANVEAALGALVADALNATTIAPGVATQWTMVTPDAAVPYQGETLEPMCSDGSPWVFFTKRGSVNKLVMYYQGGGACWDYLTCGAVKPYKQTAGPNDDPSRATTGFADLNDPRNPFRDWNAVFVPYCTGDVHWGDATYVHELNGSQVTIQHKGFVNAQVAEKWAREHFVAPEQVFVTGSSAGAYGAIMHSVYLQEGVYPSTGFAVLGDGGNGVITQEFLVNDLSKWGIEKHLPSWIPALGVPIDQLDPADLYSAPALQYPRSRFATYTTAFDGGTGGQTGFYQIMRNPTNIGVWLSWWQSSCAWNERVRAQNAIAAAAAPNYRSYVGSGSRHTAWGNDKVYTDTTGGVPPLVDWVEAMLDGSSAWTNVECTSCGTTLPGDPKPSPLQPPFDANGNIVCPGTP